MAIKLTAAQKRNAAKPLPHLTKKARAAIPKGTARRQVDNLRAQKAGFKTYAQWIKARASLGLVQEQKRSNRQARNKAISKTSDERVFGNLSYTFRNKGGNEKTYLARLKIMEADLPSRAQIVTINTNFAVTYVDLNKGKDSDIISGYITVAAEDFEEAREFGADFVEGLNERQGNNPYRVYVSAKALRIFVHYDTAYKPSPRISSIKEFSKK